MDKAELVFIKLAKKEKSKTGPIIGGIAAGAALTGLGVVGYKALKASKPAAKAGKAGKSATEAAEWSGALKGLQAEYDAAFNRGKKVIDRFKNLTKK